MITDDFLRKIIFFETTLSSTGSLTSQTAKPKESMSKIRYYSIAVIIVWNGLGDLWGKGRVIRY